MFTIKSFVRAVIQRVAAANVVIERSVSRGMQKGAVVLLAIEENDTFEDVTWLSGKIARLRIFDDNAGVMNLSVREIQGDMLLISQFTLFASTRKGNRPSYSRAAGPEVAIPLYESFIAKLQEEIGRPVQSGQFGAHMLVTLSNDGPVTVIIDSKMRE